MKNSFVFAALLAFAFVCHADKPGDELTLSTSATLRDGSTIKGTLLTSAIKGGAIFADALELPLSVVKTIGFVNTNGDAKVSLVNGDTLSLAVTTPSFDLDSALGRLAIDRAKIRNLAITPRRAIATTDAAGLVFHCTFDDESSVARPAVGPAGRFLNGRFVEGMNGNAIRVQRGLPACEFILPQGALKEKGCIEFYARLIEGKTEFSTGGDPRFFSLYNENGGGPVFEYASNNGAGDSGLSAVFGDLVTTHRGFSGLMPYSEIFHGQPYEDWHHYAMIWNEKGIDKFTQNERAPRLVILLDGKNVGKVYHFKDTTFYNSLPTKSMTLGIPMNENGPSYNNKSSFLLDDLKIWDYDKSDF